MDSPAGEGGKEGFLAAGSRKCGGDKPPDAPFHVTGHRRESGVLAGALLEEGEEILPELPPGDTLRRRPSLPVQALEDDLRSAGGVPRVEE